MKIRSGFVSNSSSSSFIISSKEKNPENIKFRIECDLTYLDDIEKISNQDELNKYILRQWDSGYYHYPEMGMSDYKKVLHLMQENNYIKELYNDFMKILNDGEIAYIIEASNENGNAIGTYVHNDSSVLKFKNAKVVKEMY